MVTTLVAALLLAPGISSQSASSGGPFRLLIAQFGPLHTFRCIIKPGFLTGRADLQIVDEASFSEHSKDFEKKESGPN
jgi:hypothetical protein